jgi:transcriptional regulator with XRE-family HTH domain
MTTAFGDWIKQRRRALDLTQHQLAEQVACSVITVQKLEAGVRRPSQQMLSRLANCLQLIGDEWAAFLQQGRAQRRAPDRGSSPSLSSEAYAVALPSPLTPLIGRDHELALLAARIQGSGANLLYTLFLGGGADIWWLDTQTGATGRLTTNGHSAAASWRLRCPTPTCQDSLNVHLPYVRR